MTTGENPFQSPRSSASPANVNGLRSDEFDQVLWEIKKQSRNGIVMAIAGILLCLPYICSPIAIYSGKRALRMMDEHNRGREFERTAKRAIQLGYLLSLIHI